MAMKTDARNASVLDDRRCANRVVSHGDRFGWVRRVVWMSSIRTKSSSFWMNSKRIDCCDDKKLTFNASMDWLYCPVLLVSLSHSIEMRVWNWCLSIDLKTGNITIGSTRGFEEPFYFQLPKQFLGDRTGSYAGYLRFGIAMEECKTALDESTLRRFPLVQIHSHDNFVVSYFGVSICHSVRVLSARQSILFISFTFCSPNNWTRAPKLATISNSAKTIGAWARRLANRTWIEPCSWPHCRMWRVFSFAVLRRWPLRVFCKSKLSKWTKEFSTKIFVFFLSVWQMWHSTQAFSCPAPRITLPLASKCANVLHRTMALHVRTRPMVIIAGEMRRHSSPTKRPSILSVLLVVRCCAIVMVEARNVIERQANVRNAQNIRAERNVTDVLMGSMAIHTKLDVNLVRARKPNGISPEAVRSNRIASVASANPATSGIFAIVVTSDTSGCRTMRMAVALNVIVIRMAQCRRNVTAKLDSVSVEMV